MASLARTLGVLLFVLQTAAPSGRYIVTAAPLDVGARIPLCLAVEPGNPKGIWWWEPVESDCSRRSTGPGVFHGENARVMTSTTTPGAVSASFRLQLITANNSSGPTYKDVVVAVSSVAIRVEGSAVAVKTTRRGDLDIPER